MSLKRRGLILTGILILTLLLLTGCLETYTTFNIGKDGAADIKFILVADEILAGDESDIAAFVIQNSFLELQTGYQYTREVRVINRTSYVYHIFESSAPVDINRHRYISYRRNDDSSCSFELRIPPLVEKVDRADGDTLVFEIIVTMPGEIETANSTRLRGRTAYWSVYKKDLVEGIVLRALARS